MSGRTKVLIGLLVVVAGIGAAVLLSHRGPHGASTPSAAVDGYLAALAASDSGELADLADPDHDADAEITARLAALGGGRLSGTTVALGDTESAFLKNARLTGTLAGTPYSDTIWLYRHGDRWFVALGPAIDAHPKGSSTAGERSEIMPE